MFQWLRNLAKSKISITLVYPPANGVEPTTTPKVVDRTSNITTIRKSNVRFVQYDIQEANEDPKTYYYTELYKNGNWNQVRNTWHSDKDKALEAHLNFVKNGVSEEKKITTVLWEGLSEEETESWVNLQRISQGCEDTAIANGRCSI